MIETYFKVVIDEETEAENIQSRTGEIYTEKRYAYFKSPITGLFVISDGKNRETFSGIDDEYNCNRIVRLLNTKENENEQLKEENQELRHFKLSIKAFAECNDNINRRTLNDLIGEIDYD